VGKNAGPIGEEAEVLLKNILLFSSQYQHQRQNSI